MKVIPKVVLRHTGQRLAQRAIWPDGARITRTQWRAMRGAEAVAHTITVEGQVIVYGFRLWGESRWFGPITL